MSDEPKERTQSMTQRPMPRWIKELAAIQRAALILQLSVTLTGLAFAVMGYNLIASGFLSPKSAVLISWGDKSLSVTQLTPGGFLAFLGAAIIIAALIFVRPRLEAFHDQD